MGVRVHASGEESTVTVQAPQKEPFRLPLVMKNLPFLVVFVTPCALAFLWYTSSLLVYRCVYVMLLTAIYWMTDTVPIAPTGFIPLVMLPILMVENGDVTANKYMQDVGMLTFTGFMIGQAAVTSGLSKRFALKILSTAGSDLRMIVVLTTLITCLMSMWFVNTAIVLFMLDTVDNLVDHLANGIGFGSLGDSMMEEWHRACKEAAEKHAHTSKLLSSAALTLQETKNTTEDHPKVSVAEVTDTIENKAKNRQSKLEEKLEILDVSDKPSDESIIFSEQTLNTLLPESEDMVRLKKENDQLLDCFKYNLLYCVVIASNIGGLMWPFTSTSNLSLQYYFKPALAFTKKEPATSALSRHVNIAVWMNFTFPIIVLMIGFSCWYLDILIFGMRRCPCVKGSTSPFCKGNNLLEATAALPETQDKVKKEYLVKYEVVKKLSSHEKGVLTVFVMCILLMLLRMPFFFTGWASNLRELLKDSTVTALFALIAFIYPKCGRDMFRGPKNPNEKPSYTPLVGWKIFQQRFPWGLLIVIGGSCALGHAAAKSKLNAALVIELHKLLDKAPPSLVLIVSLLISFGLALTIGQTGASMIAVEVFTNLSVKLENVHGLCYLTVPCVVVCSFAVLFPASTSTMAALHIKTGQFSGWNMFLKGLPIALMGVFVVFITSLSYTNLLMEC